MSKIVLHAPEIRLAQADKQDEGDTGGTLKQRFEQAMGMLGQPARQEEAIGKLRSMAESHPDFAPPHYILGLVSEAEENWDEAAMHMCKAVLVDPYSDLGVIAAEKIRFYSNCKKMDETDKAQRQFGSNLLYALGMLDLERYDEAFAEAGRATAADPSRWEPYYIAALALAANAQPDDAKRFLGKAIELAPEDIVNMIRKEMEPNPSAPPAQKAPSQGTVPPASAPMGKAAAPDKTARVIAQYNALIEAGRAAYEKGNFADATNNLKQVWALDPADESIGLMLASASIFAHDYKTAHDVLTSLSASKDKRTRKEAAALSKQLEDAESQQKKKATGN